MKRLLASFLLMAGWLESAEIKIVRWSTKNAAPAVELEGSKKLLLPLVRAGVSSVAEPQVMRLAFLGGRTLGLDARQAGELHALVTGRYLRIEKSGRFKMVPSALPYCYAAKRPTKGMATVCQPDGLDRETPVILFLHGYGGSFQLYPAVLAEAFPGHLIICPAFGISQAKVSGKYLSECLAAVSKEVGFPLKKPLLIGLSAGGVGAFLEYTRNPKVYRGLIVMGALPSKEVVARLPREGKIRLLAGADEGFVKDGSLARTEFRIRGRMENYRSELMAGQGHFFLLGAEEKTTQILKVWEAGL